MRWFNSLACVAMLLTASIVNAGIPATDQFLISVGRGQGQFHSLWVTKVDVLNTSSNPNEVRILFLERNQRNLEPSEEIYILGSHEQLTLEDVILKGFGFDRGFGAFRIISQFPVIATSRTYNVNTVIASGETGTVGVGVNGISIEASRFFEAHLIGLQEDASFRTNLAFVNVLGLPLYTRLFLYDEEGNEIGIRELTLEPYGASQRNILGFFPNAPNDKMLRVKIEAPWPNRHGVEYGGRLLAMGTVVDKVTNDGSVVEMSFDSWRPLEGVYQTQIVEQSGEPVGSFVFVLRNNPSPGEHPFPETEHYLSEWYYLFPLKCEKYETIHTLRVPFHLGIEPDGGAPHGGDYKHMGGPFGRTQLFNGDFVEYYTDTTFWISANGLIRGRFTYGIRSDTTGVWAKCIGQGLDYELYGGWVASLE